MTIAPDMRARIDAVVAARSEDPFSFEGRRNMAESHEKANPNLSARELEVLARIAEGDDSKEAGVHLHLSHHTVKSHLKHAFAKLGASNRAHAVAIAFRRGLL